LNNIRAQIPITNGMFLLTCDRKNLGVFFEDNIGRNKDKGHLYTKIPNPYIQEIVLLTKPGIKPRPVNLKATTLPASQAAGL
jgi:hypothetical protein